MDLNYDPLYPDYAVTDQSLSVWAQHGAFSNKPAFKWVNGRGREENSLSYSFMNHLMTRRNEIEPQPLIGSYVIGVANLL